jgi:hypothetical protein
MNTYRRAFIFCIVDFNISHYATVKSSPGIFNPARYMYEMETANN